MQTLRLFDTGLISFESRREHLEVIRQAESIVHALAKHTGLIDAGGRK